MGKLRNLYEEYGKKKIYFGLAILFLIIHIFILFIIYRTNISFSIDGQRFKYISDKNNKILFEDEDKNLVTINIEESEGAYTPPQIIASKYQIEYKDKIIKVDCSNWIEDGLIITLSNGKEYKQKFFSLRYMDRGYAPFDVQLVHKTNSAYDFAKDKDIIFIPFINFILILLGLAGIMYPKELWRFQHIFTVAEGEPTDWAIFSNKLMGILVLCFALLYPLLIFSK